MIPSNETIIFAAGWIVGALQMLAICIYWAIGVRR